MVSSIETSLNKNQSLLTYYRLQPRMICEIYTVCSKIWICCLESCLIFVKLNMLLKSATIKYK